MRQAEVKKHFDRIAPNYDKYKQRLSFYQKSIILELKKEIPAGKRILDWGCGTGTVLFSLKPSSGLGIDSSPKMIAIAQNKYRKSKNLRFQTSVTQIAGVFDFLLLIDVVEHLESPGEVLARLTRLMGKRSRLFVSFVAAGWEPFLWLMEKARLKMPEGPHHRVKTKKVIEMAARKGLLAVEIRKIRLGRLPVSPITLIIFRKK